MKRIQKLQAKIPNQTAYLLTNTGDIRYYTGFEFLVPTEREALLLISRQSAALLHASFSPVETPAEIDRVPGCHPEKLKSQIANLVKKEKITKLAIDKSTLYVSEFEAINNISKISITEVDRDQIWQQRAIKSTEEISNIRHAAKITNKALTETLSLLEEGISEIDLENILEEKLKKMGSNYPAFPTIVAFGQHTALPHHQPTHLKLKKNMPVLIDVGATFAGYCADMTRTTWFGSKPDKKFLELESIISDAYSAALEKLQSIPNGKEVTAKDIDDETRSIIAKKNYGQEFIHTTGHGLGLDIHEQPSLSWVNETRLHKNMVLTIEPGIYLSGKFGFRYENTVLAGDKIEELTK